jgi:aminoglycoside phosphotransferase (APT) family kinase protein
MTKINTALVQRLMAEQFPQWAGLQIKPVAVSGWDNRTFHLGPDMSVRLPSAAGYSPQVAKEQQWLPQLAPLLPLPIPAPLAHGQANAEYPWPWSVYRWLEGDNANHENISDLVGFASSLGQFLAVLQAIDASLLAGPAPGPHCFYRGGPLASYDGETRQTAKALADVFDEAAILAIWDSALATTWQPAPVWFHGDVALGNLLVKDGQLCAVIDWGCCGVGDPACDYAIAWTDFAGTSRAAFRATLKPDEATWARGRAWALWKALITLVEHQHSNPVRATSASNVIAQMLDDWRQAD